MGTTPQEAQGETRPDPADYQGWPSLYDEALRQWEAKVRRLARPRPIVTAPADDGSGRISAYDTTWPDVATKPHRRRDVK